METETKGAGNKFAIPASIIVAGLLIAGAVVYSKNLAGPTTASVREIADGEQRAASRENPLDNLSPVTPQDHIRGDVNAAVKIVEFSDTECPYCKMFHGTLKNVVAEYNGTVAWVYRHFPLDQLHSKARKEAEALECAAEIGGNEGFWAYLDRLFAVTPSNDGLNLDELPRIAEYVRLDRTKFVNCLTNGTFAEKVERDYQNAVGAGGTGTPFNIIIAPNGERLPLIGAQPISEVKAVIERALGKK